jgi:hypothetical protein
MVSPSSFVDIEENESQIVALLSFVKRTGIDDLLDYLQNSDYYTAPASTRFHSVSRGGLVQHSLNVTREFGRENALWQKPLPQDSVIISELLHDLCKVGAYTETSRGYETVKNFPKGHGKLSVARIEDHIFLTQQEKDMVLYHMSTFGIFVYREYDTLTLHKAIMRTPQVQIFASIDQADSKRKVEAAQGRRA